MFDHPCHEMRREMTIEWPLDNEFGSLLGRLHDEPVETIRFKKMKIFEELFFRNTLQVIWSWQICSLHEKKRSPSTPFNLIFNQLKHVRGIFYHDYFRDPEPARTKRSADQHRDMGQS